jgi:hypothetical protein
VLQRWAGVVERGVGAFGSVCLMYIALALNFWVGFLPTVRSALGCLTGARLPGQTDLTAVAEMLRRAVKPTQGNVVSVTIPDAGSGFGHRDKLVCLPPAWYTSDPRHACPW